MIMYPIPMLSLYVINIDFEAGKAYAISNYPYLSNIYVPKSCNTILVNYTMYAYMISGIIEISIIYLIGILLFVKIHRKLAEVKHSLSTNTLNARKQYVRALIIQASVPLIFIVLPITGIMFTVVIGMSNAEGK
uniref:G protein-coupled receptor n=1 Tax=Panagrolaimus davidi TaxID=227884 RepID=A0A914P9U0_9BILA